jgi:hypothetical protein
MRLALTDRFRARWSNAIHDEWIRNLLKQRPELDHVALEKTRTLMNSSVRDSLVEGFEHLIPAIELPDPDDRHVVAQTTRWFEIAGGAANDVELDSKEITDMKVLVVGGAGYIGSHMVKTLHVQGCQVTTLDNLSAGYRDAVRYGNFVEGDIADHSLLDSLLQDGAFDAVMHFASWIQVGESVQHPQKYYQNNVTHTLQLLHAMLAHGIRHFIFSSTAAIFGEPQYCPIDEAHPKGPINPYGRTKWMIEQALADYASAYGLHSVALRYFNAAGADPDAELGERHDPETHLIPLVLQAASGRRPAMTVFGRDYPTPDGAAVSVTLSMWPISAMRIGAPCNS